MSDAPSKVRSQSERRVSTEEFKCDAVRLANERGNISQVAHDLGLHESVLTRWRKRLATAPERREALGITEGKAEDCLGINPHWY